MNIDDSTKLLGIPVTIITVMVAVFTYSSSRNKVRFESAKIKYDLAKIASEEVSKTTKDYRLIEVAVASLVGVSTNGRLSEKLWNSSLTLDEMKYIINVARRMLDFDGLTIRHRYANPQHRLIMLWNLMMVGFATMLILNLIQIFSSSQNDREIALWLIFIIGLIIIRLVVVSVNLRDSIALLKFLGDTTPQDYWLYDKFVKNSQIKIV